MYDLIGDIHGHADALQSLLGELGYARQMPTVEELKRRIAERRRINAKTR